MMEKLLRSRAAVAVLGIVLFSEGLHLREIARRAGVAPSEAKRELDTLESIGLVRKTAKANLSVFELNNECPFAGDLRSLYVKTEGVAPLLTRELKKLGGLEWAFVYGSFANGSVRQTSDVDVLAIGDLKENELDMACFEIQDKTGREVNYVHWTSADFRKKLREKGAFISSVLVGKKLWLAGDKNEFERIAEKARNLQGRARREERGKAA